VHIPTYMITHEEARLLVTSVRDSPHLPVILKYSLEVIPKEEQGNASASVPYNLWYTGVQDFKGEFDLREIEDVYIQLSANFDRDADASHAEFTPRTYTWKCLEGYCNENVKKLSCISNGEYCLNLPTIPGVTLDLSPDQRMALKDKFFLEMIRSRCLSEQLPDRFLAKWFTYMQLFKENCYEASLATFKKYTKECSHGILESLDIPVDDIEKCVEESFEMAGDLNSKNKLLEIDRKQSLLTNVRGSP
jgi:hypothetical protein